MLLVGFSASATAENVGGYVGVGLGLPTVAYGSSSVAFKLFGGAKVHTFEIGQAGKLDLAIEGEYVNFGSSSSGGTSWTNSGFGVAGVGLWIIPKRWAPWAEEKVAIIAKAGGSRISNSSNNGYYNSYTYTGLTTGVGAEYRFAPQAVVRAMVEYYPGAYNVIGISGILKF